MFPKSEDLRFHADYAHLAETTIDHEIMFDAIHSRTMAMRKKLGMKRLGEGPNSNVYEEMKVVGGATASAMGFVNGLMYHSNAQTLCTDSFQGIFVNFDTFSGVAAHLYEPWYWPDFIVSIQDMTALTSMIYSHCNVDKLMHTLTNVISIEGATSLLGRGVALLNFEFKTVQDTIDNPFSTDADLGEAWGEAFAALLKFSI